MVNIRILNIQEAGRDYVILRDGEMDVRLNFDDDENFTKEDNAAFFRSLVGKPAAIPSADSNGPFFIAVDFWKTDTDLRVIPFTFATSTVEASV